MKRILYFTALGLALVAIISCGGNKQQDDNAGEVDSTNIELSDSLATAKAENDSLLALVSDISDGMSQLKNMEGIVSSGDLSSETPSKKQQIKNDMQLIAASIQQRKARLAELEKKLSKSSNYSASMKKTVESLKKQLAEQEETINSLNQKLAEAHIMINNLNTRVDSLNTVNKTVSREKAQAQAESTRLADQLNTCYYVIGNKNELKAHKIISTGFLRKTKIMEGDFEKSYFTQADKRTLQEIPLHSKKAQVMSKHPAGSYSIVESGGMKVLKITDSAKFWDQSNYLVIKID